MSWRDRLRTVGGIGGSAGNSYTWDWAGRLTGVTVSGTPTTYTYDRDGNRVARAQGTATATYLWDRQSGLPLLLDDGAGSYVHGGGMRAQTDGAGTPSYLLGDGLGSVRAITNASITPVAGVDHDVFGAVRAAGGTATSAFGFTGEQTDAESGFGFLRARSYDPGDREVPVAGQPVPQRRGDAGLHPLPLHRQQPGDVYDSVPSNGGKAPRAFRVPLMPPMPRAVGPPAHPQAPAAGASKSR